MPEKELTEEVIVQWLKDPESCPYCYSGDVDVVGEYQEGRNLYRDMICNKCKEMWEEQFRLVKAEEV